MSYMDEDYAWLKKKIRQRSEVYGLSKNDWVELLEDVKLSIESDEPEFSFLFEKIDEEVAE